MAAALIVGAAGVVYVTRGSLSKPAEVANTTAEAEADGDVAGKTAAVADPLGLRKLRMAKLEVSEPKPAPDKSFVDGTGKARTLADFRGKVVVVNLWATWCAPCKQEMPTLAKLAASYAGKPVEIAAISIDNAAATGEAKAFIATHRPLAFYQDAKLALPFAFSPPAQGFPTTVLYDKAGIERARVVGEADWSGPEARKVIDRLLDE